MVSYLSRLPPVDIGDLFAIAQVLQVLVCLKKHHETLESGGREQGKNAAALLGC